MNSFKQTIFFRMLKEKAGSKFAKLLVLCAVSGLAQGLTVFSILHGLQELMKNGYILFHQFLFFAFSLGLFFFSFRYVMGTVSVVALTAIADWRMRIAVKIRAIDLRSFEQISTSRIQKILMDNMAVAIEAARMLVIAASSVAMIIVAGFKMFSISLSGASFMLFLMILGVYYLIYANKKVNVLQAIAIKYNLKFADSLKGIVGGFSELKLSRNKTADLFNKELLPDADNALVNNTTIEQCYSNGMSFFEMLNYFVLGISLFLLPGFFNIEPQVMGQLLVVGMFCLSPITSLILLIPLLAKTEYALMEMKSLENEVDAAIETNAKDGIETGWKLRDIPAPKFDKIEIRNLDFSYGQKNDAHAFSIHVDNFTLSKGELLFIRGGNGSGKTTLMRILAGLYTNYSGSLTINENAVNERNLCAYRNLFAVVFSDFYIFDSPLGVPEANLDKINNILGKMELANKVWLTEEGRFSTTDLSAGQRKRLALTCAMLEGREIYLFDEVAADFDPEFRVYFYRTFLQELKDTGATVLAISHDDRFFDVADRIVTMDKGRIIDISNATT